LAVCKIVPYLRVVDLDEQERRAGTGTPLGVDRTTHMADIVGNEYRHLVDDRRADLDRPLIGVDAATHTGIDRKGLVAAGVVENDRHRERIDAGVRAEE